MRSLSPLAVAALVLAGCGASGSGTAVPASAAREGDSVLTYVWDGRPLVVRADATTLEPRGRELELDELPVSAWARAPKGGGLAIGSGERSRLTFADLRTMRSRATVDLGAAGYVAALAWPSPRRVVAALGGIDVGLVVVDPASGRVVARRRLSGTLTRAVRSPRGLVLLVSPRDGIGRATVAVATPTGIRTVRLALDAGVSPPAVVEPGLAVSPDGRSAVVVPGGSRILEVDLKTLAVAEHELSQPISLLGRLRSWLEPPALAKGPLDGPVRSAAWADGDTVVVAGSDYRPLGERATVSEAAGVLLIDTRDWSVRTLEEAASSALVAGDALLAFGGTHGPAGLRGTGLRGFAPDGGERFHLFGGRYVADVSVAGGRAYVSHRSETELRIEVVDIASGKVVGTVRTRTHVEVLPLDVGDGIPSPGS